MINPKELNRPLTVIQATLVLAAVASRMGISTRSLRCVALLAQVDCNTYKVTIQTLADLLGYSYLSCWLGVKEGVIAGLIKPLRKKNGGLGITLAALDVLARLKREESETRTKTLRFELPKQKRAYNRKAAPAVV